MTLSKPNSWALSALAGIALLAGCNPPANENAAEPDAANTTANTAAASDGRIVLLSNSSSPFWAAVEKGMDDAKTQLGANAELMRSDGTVAGQIQRLEQIAAQDDIKGVAISVIDAGAEGIADRMKELQKKGVYVLTFDADGPADARYAYIGANNVKAGEEAGKAAAQLMPEGGKVVAFVGSMAASNAQERVQGFKQGAGPKIEVVDVMEDKTDQSKARQNVTSAIQTHTDAKGLLGLWSYNAPAIAEEVTRAGKADQYKIVTFDAEPNILVPLQKGVIDATVIQQPYEYGFQSVKLLDALIKKNDAVVKEMVPENKIVEIPVRTVVSDPNGPIKTGENVITFDALKQYLDEKGLKGT